MHSKPFIIFLVAILVGCAAPSATRSEYNLGVDAYRVKDYAAARLHWSKAVDEQELSAFNNLGYLLYYGLGGEPDTTRAVVLWLKAARDGHSEAQWHLGRAFEDGEGTKQSTIEAYAWYRCAVANSQAGAKDNDSEAQVAQDASKALTSILRKLPAEKLEAAELLARQYIAMYARTAGA